MSITAGSLYRDTGNFLRHQLITITLISLLTAFITVLISQAPVPDPEQLSMLRNENSAASLFEMIQNMTPEQQRILLRASGAGTLAALVGNTLLLGGMLCLLPMASSGQKVSALRTIGASAPLLPRLLLQTFLITLVVQLGFMVLVVPGLLLAVLLSLAPVIMASENSGVFASLRSSMKIVWKNVRLVAPAVAVWLLAKIALMLAVSSLSALPATAGAVVLNAAGNLVSAILIIYLYRLYTLLR